MGEAPPRGFPGRHPLSRIYAVPGSIAWSGCWLGTQRSGCRWLCWSGPSTLRPPAVRTPAFRTTPGSTHPWAPTLPSTAPHPALPPQPGLCPRCCQPGRFGQVRSRAAPRTPGMIYPQAWLPWSAGRRAEMSPTVFPTFQAPSREALPFGQSSSSKTHSIIAHNVLSAPPRTGRKWRGRKRASGQGRKFTPCLSSY